MEDPHALLYAFSEGLNRAAQFSLYAPVHLADDMDTVQGQVMLTREGIEPFPVVNPKVSKREDGVCFIQAPCGRNDRSTYRYMLLQETATVDRVSREIIPSAPGMPLVGLTQWDRVEVDPRAGLYFVDCKNTKEETALLLGPFSRHVDALLSVDRASNFVKSKFAEGVWWAYGTLRIEPGMETSGYWGKLNEAMMTKDELEDVAKCLADLVPVPRPKNASMSM